MLFKKRKDFIKMSFNCDIKIYERVEDIKEFYFCNTTDVINEALREYIKKFDKKMEKLAVKEKK